MKKLERKKERKQKLFSLPLFPEKTGKQLTILTSKGFIAKCSSPSNELTCTSSHSTAAELQELHQQACHVEFSHSSGLAARQSNGIPLFPSHMCAHIHSPSRVMSIAMNVMADAAVLTTGVERRGYPIFLNQLHHFIYNVEDSDNSKYCNNDAKDEVPIWTKRRGQMSESPRKEELNIGERIVSEHMQMPMRKIIMI